MFRPQDEDNPLTKRKRGGDQEFDSEDSDGGFGRGATYKRAVRFAGSTAGSAGGRSHRSGGTMRSMAKSVTTNASGRTAKSARGSQHSGSRCRALASKPAPALPSTPISMTMMRSNYINHACLVPVTLHAVQRIQTSGLFA